MTIRKKIENYKTDLDNLEECLKQFDISEEMQQEFIDLGVKIEALKVKHEKLKVQRQENI
ncbi:hypothetical protein H6G41_32455 [Tolypothrix sp. FACHB-123]|uniref:hypothetical protein n=1 Tax=Tolypothrix sp. FACHB-123 TaxID=2692868 RepID=UPI0016834FD5|nr:hypothetical protein [Tolypothrix sp. FACHB-123]MBD2359244.1 hypothetical protein [Tolypothrix sp. FACHB-123]